ncbi:hypothetical protein LC085_21600 [Bacillus tianshenii]|uniref:hypothetical protein n=1 Tax=Sutcliffiella tianshenii TaxID=1463404 RepID=UPI001CD70E25|nr:hypothetical protein [Bacillus tianshenii]MCA1322475.1 hypothetical protein [Bacillus tianshenii]
MTIKEILLNLLVGFISGGITSFIVTKYFKGKEERESNIRRKKEDKELEQRQIREEYVDFKQYLHELKQYLNNIYIAWDVVSTDNANQIEVKKSLKHLNRYLSGMPYDVTKDFQKIKLDYSSQQHLKNIDKSKEELMDFVSESLESKMIFNQEKLVEKILLLSLAMGKTRVSKIKGNIVTIDFYLPEEVLAS